MKKTITLGCIALTGCSTLGLKSTPWPNFTTIHDAEAIEFMRGVPDVEADILRRGEDDFTYADDDGRIVGLSVSGGGLRASGFTLGALQGLQEAGYLDQIDFISSNSGGGWGIAAYLADRALYEGEASYKLANRRDVISSRFEDAFADDVKCLPNVIDRHITRNLTYGDLYSADPDLPEHFVNAAILPNEMGFVFTNEYLDHYDINTFKACGDKMDDIDVATQSSNPLRDLSYGFAAATSGSVPLFYFSSATTNLCDEGESETSLSGSTFCIGNARELHLVDGGIHDNHAYKTIAEIMGTQRAKQDHSLPSEEPDLLISIDPTTNLVSPLSSKAGKRSQSLKLAAGFGTGSGFSGQDATAARLRDLVFENLGMETHLLDFFSAAGMENVDFSNLDDNDHLKGLYALQEYMVDSVACYDDAGEYIKPDVKGVTSKAAMERSKKRAESEDCRANNAFRTGTLYKTTYLYSPRTSAEGHTLFDVIWDVGVLVARVNMTSEANKPSP